MNLGSATGRSFFVRWLYDFEITEIVEILFYVCLVSTLTLWRLYPSDKLLISSAHCDARPFFAFVDDDADTTVICPRCSGNDGRPFPVIGNAPAVFSAGKVPFAGEAARTFDPYSEGFPT